MIGLTKNEQAKAVCNAYTMAILADTEEKTDDFLMIAHRLEEGLSPQVIENCKWFAQIFAFEKTGRLAFQHITEKKVKSV